MKNKFFAWLGFVVILAIILTVSIFVFINKKELTNNFSNSGKIKIVATLFPVYDMAKYIAGDKADILLILPPGVEAHSFEPKPSDVIKINEGDIFVYTGKFMEPWAEDIINGLDGRKVEVVDSSVGAKMMPSVFHDADESNGAVDPHIWLNFDNAKIMVENIANALIKKDPANKELYRQNLESYKNGLTGIDNEYRTSLSACKDKEIIYAGHYAFGYLASRYGLKYLAAQGVSPNSEPTAQDFINLISQIKENNIGYVFYEELSSPKIAQTIADETNAKLLLLNAAHNLSKENMDNGLTFFQILRNDLSNLKIGLQCQ
jgi:zinc transport system substrate-binding protein